MINSNKKMARECKKAFESITAELPVIYIIYTILQIRLGWEIDDAGLCLDIEEVEATRPLTTLGPHNT